MFEMEIKQDVLAKLHGGMLDGEVVKCSGRGGAISVGMLSRGFATYIRKPPMWEFNPWLVEDAVVQNYHFVQIEGEPTGEVVE